MSENPSKVSWSVMPEAEKLYWKDGHSNLIEWWESLYNYARLIFSEEIVEVLINKAIPAEWLSEWEPPDPGSEPTDEFGIKLALEQRSEHNKNYKNWNGIKGKLTSFVILSQTESSRLRLDKYHEQTMKDHVLKCSILEILDLIEKTHTFSGAVSGFDDQEAVSLEWSTFKPEGNENLDVYTNRYQRLITKVRNTGATVDDKTLVYRYLKGLRAYTKSSLVQLNVITYLSLVDKTGFPTDFAMLIEELQGLDQSENPVGTKQSNSNRFAVQSIGKKKDYSEMRENLQYITFPDGSSGQKFSDGTYQVFTQAGISKKFKKDSKEYNGLFKPSHVSKRPDNSKRSDKYDNKHTKELVKKRIREDKTKKLTEAQVYKSLQCNRCNKWGHIAPDCKMQEIDSSTKVMSINADLPISEHEKRNQSGFFSCNMTSHSKPMTEEDIYNEKLYSLKNYHYCNIDDHANIHVWCNDEHVKNIRTVKAVKVVGFGGMSKYLDTVGDHPLLGEVFIDKDNGYNIISVDLMREQQGYFRRINKDNTKQYLYNDDLKSVFTFERDPVDRFFKCSIKDLNIELLRVFPNLCMAIS